MWFFAVWTLTNLNASWNFRNSTSSEKWMRQPNSLPNDGRDMRPGPKWTSNNSWLETYTPGTNDLMKSQAFPVQICQVPRFHDRKTWSSCRCRRITLRANALRATWNMNSGAARQWNSRQLKKLWFFVVWTLASLNASWNFRNSTFSKKMNATCETRTRNEAQTTPGVKQIPPEQTT